MAQLDSSFRARGLAAVALALVAAAASAQGVNKWVDKDGRVHYGDRPPADAVTQPLSRGTVSGGGRTNSAAKAPASTTTPAASSAHSTPTQGPAPAPAASVQTSESRSTDDGDASAERPRSAFKDINFFWFIGFIALAVLFHRLFGRFIGSLNAGLIAGAAARFLGKFDLVEASSIAVFATLFAVVLSFPRRRRYYDYDDDYDNRDDRNVLGGYSSRW